MVGIEFPEQLQYMDPVVLRYDTALIHELLNCRISEELHEVLSSVEAAWSPYQTRILVLQTCGELDPDPNLDAHDLCRFKQLGNYLRAYIVVVDHPQESNSLDPRIHYEVGGSLPSLRAGIVNVMIERKLLPTLRHLQ